MNKCIWCEKESNWGLYPNKDKYFVCLRCYIILPFQAITAMLKKVLGGNR